MDNFDLRKYLVENKVTTNSRMVITETLFNTGKEYLKAAAQEYWDVNLDDPDAEEQLEDAGANEGGTTTLPVDAVLYMMNFDDQVGRINNQELEQYIEKNGLEMQSVAEYQFNEKSYNFLTHLGAGEYESTIEIFRLVDEKGNPVKIEGYDFVVGTDRGPLGDEYALINTPHAKIIKSIANIFDVDAGWYAGYKGRTQN
jgi:hypothetical protein